MKAKAWTRPSDVVMGVAQNLASVVRSLSCLFVCIKFGVCGIPAMCEMNIMASSPCQFQKPNANASLCVCVCVCAFVLDSCSVVHKRIVATSTTATNLSQKGQPVAATISTYLLSPPHTHTLSSRNRQWCYKER